MNLLERNIPLQGLETALLETTAGNGRVILISGEAGIGKTSLVEYFTNHLPQPSRVLWGACDALFTPRPFGPLYDIAAQIPGDLASLLSQEADRSAIFSACLQIMQNQPVVIVFEDIHWADEATLDLLKFLGRRIQRTQALLIATYRDDELSLQHPLRLLLGDLATSTATHRISLTHLSVEAVRQLAGKAQVDAVALHRQTGGNPFFVTEVLATEKEGVPPTVRDAVLARAARLSSSGRAVLNAAAVIGTRIEPWLLAEVTHAESEAIDESLGLGILRVQGDLLVFRHELGRQTLLDALPPHQRVFLHQAVLEALKASPITQNDLSQLAHHAQATGDKESVLEHAPAAARQASRASAHREAAALYALALRFAAELPADERARLLESYSHECDLVGQQAEGITARRKAAELWREIGNPLKQGENLAHMIFMLNRTGQNAEAEMISQEAIEILEALPPGRELALAYRMQAHLRLVNRDSQEALVWAEKALELAERFEDEDILAAIFITIGTARLLLDFEHGCQYLESKLDTVRQAGLDARVAHIYTNLGSGSGELFQFQHASRYLETGIAYAGERDLDSHRLYMLAWQALIQVYLGHWREAAKTAVAVLQNPRANVITRITALIARGRLHTRQGIAGENAALEEALQLATWTETIQRLGPARAARAEAAWLAGDAELALKEAQAVIDLALSKRHPWICGELAYWLHCAGAEVKATSWLANPYALQISGDWQGAANAWEASGCPYEQARALAEGDTRAQLAALATFEKLGAKPMIEITKQRLRAAGVQTTSYGPRTTTRENFFGLTNRQLEILTLLMENLTNIEIAARLYISPKTVDHHVSAVLAKLDVASRDEAAQLARQHPDFQSPK